MSAPRFVRGTKSRFFLYVGMLVFFGVVVYVFHETQMHLGEVQKTAEKCQQQQESLAAQLQVIFEYKVRLEKSLQQEKADHRHSKEELQNQMEEEKRHREKDSTEFENKYSSLQRQYKMLQGQCDDLQEDFTKARQSQLQIIEDKNKLLSQVQAIQQELDQVQAMKDKEIEELKTHYLSLQVENEKLQKRVQDTSTQNQQATDMVNYLQKQKFQLERDLEDTQRMLKHACQSERPVQIVIPEQTNNKESEASKQSSRLPSQDQQNQQNVLQQPENLSKASSTSSTPKTSEVSYRIEKSANAIPIPPPDQKGEHVRLVQDPLLNLEKEKSYSAGKEEEIHNVERPEGMLIANANRQHDFLEDNKPYWHGQAPRGVVPAPLGYDFNHVQDDQNYFQPRVEKDINKIHSELHHGMNSVHRPVRAQRSKSFQIPSDNFSLKNFLPSNIIHSSNNVLRAPSFNNRVNDLNVGANGFLNKNSVHNNRLHSAHQAQGNINQFRAPMQPVEHNGNLQLDAPGHDAWQNVQLQAHAGKEESHQIDQPLAPDHNDQGNQFVLVGENDHQIAEPHLEGHYIDGAQGHKESIHRREAVHPVDPKQHRSMDWPLAGVHNIQREAPLHVNHQYNENGDYDKDSYAENKAARDSGMRWGGKAEEGEIPRVPQEDLQLEEGDEDGDDDEDVDQIDDDNDRVNMAKAKQVKKDHSQIGQVNKHESVMVQPK